MLDMSDMIVAKSDQINAADLIGTSRTVTVAGVKKTGKEQAVELQIKGDAKVWRPNKNTVRVLARSWGNDGDKWIGKSATLYCDPSVKFGAHQPGGIRISHLSHIDSSIVMAVQERKGVLKTITIEPLEMPRDVAAVDPAAQAQTWFDGYLTEIDATADLDALIAVQTKHAKALTKLATQHPILHEQAVLAGTERHESLSAVMAV